MLKKFPFELMIWITGLIFVIASNPNEPHYSFCVFKLLGFKHCPGCGLGHSIGFLFRGQWRASWQAHPLGAFALIVLLRRIYILIKQQFYILKVSTHGN